MTPEVPGFQRVCDMVEDGRVVVRHVFYGRTEAEAKHMERSHVKADASLRAAVEKRKYKGVDIKAVRPGEPLPPVKEARAILEHGSLVWTTLRERQSGGRGPIAPGTKVLGDQRQVPQGKGGPRPMPFTDAGTNRAREDKDEKGHGSYPRSERPEASHPAGRHMPGTYEERPDRARRREEPSEHGPGKRGIYDEVRETGWTDEARAAALAARQHGYDEKARAAGVTVYGKGEHVLSLRHDGSWVHARFGSPREKKGKYAAQLDAHLSDVHGPRSKESEVGWTDDARAAAIAARRAHAAKAGAIYNGVQRGVGPVKDSHLFTDLKYGGTFDLPVAGPSTPEFIRRAADKIRAEHAAGGAKELTDEDRASAKRRNDAKWEKELQPASEAKDAKGHGSEKRGVVVPEKGEVEGRQVERRGFLSGRKIDYELIADGVNLGHVTRVLTGGGDRMQPHIRYSGWQIHGVVKTSREEAEQELIRRGERFGKFPAREAKDAKGHGSERRSVFAPASHDEPTHPAARTEKPADRAARIRGMKVPADRAAVIRRALGMRETAIRPVRATLVVA